MCFFLKDVLIYLKIKVTQRGRETHTYTRGERDLLSTDTLPRWLQCAMAGGGPVQSQKPRSSSRVQRPKYFPRPISRELDQSGKAEFEFVPLMDVGIAESGFTCHLIVLASHFCVLKSEWSRWECFFLSLSHTHTYTHTQLCLSDQY